MGLLGKKRPEPPKFVPHICADGPRVSITLKGDEVEPIYSSEPYRAEAPKIRFRGSVAEAREYLAALTKAVEDATRLEGAVASIYQK